MFSTLTFQLFFSYSFLLRIQLLHLCFIWISSISWIACTSHKTRVIQKYIHNVILGKGYDQRQLKKESSITIYIHQEADLVLHS